LNFQVKSLDAELESLRKTGEQQRNRQQVARTAPLQTPGDFRAAAGTTNNGRIDETTGLGLHVWEGLDGYMVVRSVLPNGASGKSGLIHEGDAIISLDGVDMRGKVSIYIDRCFFSAQMNIV
jgi:C-terminal processing protease CtpA/Prc